MQVLKFARDFIENFKRLVVYADTRSLEGFLGGLFLLIGLCELRTYPFVSVGLLAGGVCMLYGAASDVRDFRIRGSQVMAVLWYVLTWAFWTVQSGGKVVALFLSLTLSWICWRIAAECSPSEEIAADGGYRSGELDSGRGDRFEYAAPAEMAGTARNGTQGNIRGESERGATTSRT